MSDGVPPTVEQLLVRLARLETALAERDALIGQLRAENARLAERVAELERRLGQNPRNSSKPPSSEGYGKPPPRSRRRGSGRRPGGQPGNGGHTLMQRPDPDEVVVHAPGACAGCGDRLTAAAVTSVESRQVVDLPPVRLTVTEHRLEHRRCARCGAVTMAGAADGVPAGAGAPAQYGPGIRAAASYLVAGQHLPYERAAATLADLLGAPVSPGSVAAWVAEVAADLGEFTAAVRDQLAGRAVVNFDETGLRVDGKLSWVHSASADTLTLYTRHDRRGVEAMTAAGVLPAFRGVAVHDGWKPYRRYDVTHALCNAHHLRELTGVAEHGGQDWAAEMARLLVEIHRVVEQAKEAGADGLAADLIDTYRARDQRIVQAGWAANPGGHPGRRGSPAANLLDRLDGYRNDVLRFAADFRVPFENNLAERAIRMVKLRQKISGCLRTTAGATAFCALRSYLSTAAKQGHAALAVLRQLHQGQPWLPAAGMC